MRTYKRLTFADWRNTSSRRICWKFSSPIKIGEEIILYWVKDRYSDMSRGKALKAKNPKSQGRMKRKPIYCCSLSRWGGGGGGYG
jgi:hypothetical protein